MEAAKADADRTSPPIHLYAEHLRNIRTLSVQATFATHSNKETKATLSVDGSLLKVSHEGEEACIRLPVSIPGGHSDATLTIPEAPSKSLSFRLKIEENRGTDGLLGNGNQDDENIVPWAASDLSAETDICCAECRTTLVERHQIQQWKDLPSDGWAELMDFWHCHKPDVPHDHGHDHASQPDLTSRRITESSQLKVQPSVGLVGPTFFLLAAEDCPTLSVSLYFPALYYVLHLFLFAVGSKNRLFRPRGHRQWKLLGYKSPKAS
ncbi:hypothetical protein BAUCODRAFT_158932 [Baudoinia panamericana UAMH 10762]|uniref:Ubiquitin-conjugating enzyme E2-binding protein n=1 Tax=Baudoinia panamericana (strain UAMH 10762) TaxID=717646 RepID=M2MNZ3_BAUPA|nr:uncharacterized protein BAUCODRAFT_158932 [Baudoinia panamericana UAMH 10762]EMC93183.1 hypothetical protein BAUCODRAFT_158932 [Baudoinia panamericana UAMH 10762]